MGLRRSVLAISFLLGIPASDASAQSVVAHVEFTHAESKSSTRKDTADKPHQHAPKGPLTVVWLTPFDRQPGQQSATGSFVMAQKDKTFAPHLLVMPVGSTVSFPNRDPFFHNVFSFFNGRRFDLGLYQSGQSRSVVFNRFGVSYIFCNIHPEMSAIIITLDTPYFAYPDDHGDVKIANVPPGNYTLQVWSEAISPEAKQPAGRRVTVNANGRTDLGAIPIQATPGALADHLNKFGEPYNTHSPPAY